MLCQLVKSIPAGNDYINEVKLDGYRIIAHLSKSEVALITRKRENYGEL